MYIYVDIFLYFAIDIYVLPLACLCVSQPITFSLSDCDIKLTKQQFVIYIKESDEDGTAFRSSETSLGTLQEILTDCQE